MDRSFNVNAPAFMPPSEPFATSASTTQKLDKTPPLEQPQHSSIPKGPSDTKNEGKGNLNNKSKNSRNRKQPSNKNNGSKSGQTQPSHSGANKKSSNNHSNRRRMYNNSLHNDYDSDDYDYPDLQDGSRGRNRRYSNSTYIKYGRPDLPPPDNATYLQTTCRFLLDPDHQEEYTHLLGDPDAHVPINRVMRVLSRSFTCPICLDDAKAPRMLRCGHVMCYPCFLRFIEAAPSTAPEPSIPRPSYVIGSRGYNSNSVPQTAQPSVPVSRRKECPQCFEYIYPSQILPVTFLDFDEKFDTPRQNSEVVLRLMFRPQADIRNNGEATFMNAVPVSAPDLAPSLFNSIPIVSPTALMFSRLMLPTKQYLLEQFDKEIDELNHALAAEEAMYGNHIEFEEVAKYYKKAISAIKSSIPDIKYSDSLDEEKIRRHQKSLNINSENIALASKDNVIKSPEDYLNMYDETSAYFFYQTAFQSESKYTISPSDVKILRHEFGSYKNFPSTIIARVQNVIYGHYMSPEIRKRFKYLNHLPDHTPVAFIECDWLSTAKSRGNKGKKKGKDKPDANVDHVEDRGNVNEPNSESLQDEDIQNLHIALNNIDGPLCLSDATISHFRKDLLARSEEIHRKEQREKKQAKRYQDLEDKKMRESLWSDYSGPNSSDWQPYDRSSNSADVLSNAQAFPSLEETRAITEQSRGRKNQRQNSQSSATTPTIAAEENSSTVPSEPVAAPIPATLSAAPSTSTTASKSENGIVIFATPKKKTVWGTDAVINQKQRDEEMRRVREEAVQSGWVDFYNIDLKANGKNSLSVPEEDGNQVKAAGKKKAKPKKIVLMSTTR